MRPEEIERLLETYFAGPITDEDVDKLHRTFEELVAAPARYAGHQNGFTANLRFGDGLRS